MFIGDTDNLGKAFSTCVLQQMEVPLQNGMQRLSIGDFGMLYIPGSFLTCSFWVPLASEEEKIWLFGLRA